MVLTTEARKFLVGAVGVTEVFIFIGLYVFNILLLC
jgi:hypothetical protein